MLARRVAEAFGSHKTVDERFDQLEAQLTALAKRAKGFKKVVNGYMVDLKKFAKSSLHAAESMCVYYEDEPKEPMHKILDTFRLMQKDTLTTKYPLLVKTVEERVNASLQRLTEEISRVQARIKLRNDARLSYDHYTVKLAGLKKERDKVISQGKLASWKNRDRYERNGRKFEDSKKNYEFLNSAVTDEIQALLDDRFLHINAFCTACVKMQLFFFSAYGKRCASIIPPMKQALQSGLRRRRPDGEVAGSPKSDQKVTESIAGERAGTSQRVSPKKSQRTPGAVSKPSNARTSADRNGNQRSQPEKQIEEQKREAKEQRALFLKQQRRQRRQQQEEQRRRDIAAEKAKAKLKRMASELLTAEMEKESVAPPPIPTTDVKYGNGQETNGMPVETNDDRALPSQNTSGPPPIPERKTTPKDKKQSPQASSSSRPPLPRSAPPQPKPDGGPAPGRQPSLPMSAPPPVPGGPPGGPNPTGGNNVFDDFNFDPV